MKILIAEDHQYLGPGLVKILMRMYPAARICLAKDGNEGLMVYSQLKPDLVITDWNMPPGMNGGQLAIAIKERNPNQKIILWSGSLCPTNYSQYFTYILPKDMDSCLWRDMVEEALHGKNDNTTI